MKFDTLIWPETNLRFQVPVELSSERTAALNELCWILGCWQVAIIKSYTDASPRRLEISRKTKEFLRLIREKLTQDEYEEITNTLELT
jgi:hypothetical protein